MEHVDFFEHFDYFELIYSFELFDYLEHSDYFELFDYFDYFELFDFFVHADAASDDSDDGFGTDSRQRSGQGQWRQWIDWRTGEVEKRQVRSYHGC